MKSALVAGQNFKPDVLVVPNVIYGPFMCIAEALQIPVVTFDLQINHPTSEFPLFTMKMGKVPDFLNRSLYRICLFLFLTRYSCKLKLYLSRHKFAKIIRDWVE